MADSKESFSVSDEEVEKGNYGTEEIQQQLQILQSLLPNSTQIDARSILEDASDYLRRIHLEMEKIEKEVSQGSSGGDGSSSRTETHNTNPVPHILRVETEKLMGSRFVVKIIWKKGPGVAGHVQRVIESLELDLKITSINVVHDKNPLIAMITTVFVEVMNEMPMTEEELHDLIAARLGVT